MGEGSSCEIDRCGREISKPFRKITIQCITSVGESTPTINSCFNYAEGSSCEIDKCGREISKPFRKKTIQCRMSVGESTLTIRSCFNCGIFHVNKTNV